MYFEVSNNEKNPIVCNVPHSGTVIPEEFKGDFTLNETELQDEVLYMADNYTDILYGELLFISSFIISKISRVVLDIERLENMEDEPMSKVGMSALYTRTSNGSLLRNISKENKKMLGKVYKDYHAAFLGLVNGSLLRSNMAIVIDCHSFPSTPRVYEPEQEVNRPDICLGVDKYHTPQELVTILKSSFEEVGYSVGINTPFAGSIVPLSLYKKDKRVISVMIEINRKLYMHEETFEKTSNFSEVSKAISRCVITSLNQFVKTI